MNSYTQSVPSTFPAALRFRRGRHRITLFARAGKLNVTVEKPRRPFLPRDWLVATSKGRTQELGTLRILGIHGI